MTENKPINMPSIQFLCKEKVGRLHRLTKKISYAKRPSYSYVKTGPSRANLERKNDLKMGKNGSFFCSKLKTLPWSYFYIRFVFNDSKYI